MYKYEVERERIFTEAGQRLFLAVRDTTFELLKVAGACTMAAIMNAVQGSFSNWDVMACVDRMIELNELKEIAPDPNRRGQDRVFVQGARRG